MSTKRMSGLCALLILLDRNYGQKYIKVAMVIIELCLKNAKEERCIMTLHIYSIYICVCFKFLHLGRDYPECTLSHWYLLQKLRSPQVETLFEV